MVSLAVCLPTRILGALCCLLVSQFAPAAAQPADVLRCSYERGSDAASALLRSLRGDETSRLRTAAALSQLGKDALPGLMAAIPESMEHNVGSNSWAQRDLAILLTDVTRAILSGDTQAILRFRDCTTDIITKPLIWAARGDNDRIRVNSANILANVVDNTTVCFVLHHLRDATISASGRINLLGITNSMASYAYKENVDNITKTLDIVNKQIGLSQTYDQSRTIIRDISLRMAKSENRNTPLGSLGKYCSGYNFDASLD